MQATVALATTNSEDSEELNQSYRPITPSLRTQMKRVIYQINFEPIGSLTKAFH